MKTFIKIVGIIVGIAIAGVIGYAAYTVGIPYLMAKTEYDRNRPTIEKLETRNDSLVHVIDTLAHKNELLEMKVQLQEELISSQKSSVSLQRKIQSQLESLEYQLSDGTKSRNSNEPNGRK